VHVVETSSWVPRGVALDLPSAARVYDYLLGGGHNFEADRALAERLESVLPARDMARLNRAFLGRVVDFLAHAGIRQFLDLGSGIPTVGNVHEVAQRVRPDSRVVYVDYEPVAVAHSEMLLRDNQNAGIVQADLRKPEEILHARVTRRLLDFGEPVALLMVGVVQFLADADDPWGLAASYRDVLAPGSYLALSAFTADNAPEGMAGAVEVFSSSQDPIHPRTREEIIRMFDGFELIEPGVVYTPEWRPEREDDVGDNVRRANLYGGVGYKR
jgi:SAM-dependent methyltransferase